MRFEVAGLLFDLDGTLVNSSSAVKRAWTWFAERHSLDPATMLPLIHGRRSIDSIRRLVPHLDAEAEDALIRAREAEDTEGVAAIPGALPTLRHLPPERWGIVTSGTQDVARARLRAAGLPLPKVLVTGEDVVAGKPAPDGFLEGAKRLGFAPEICLAFEDTASGIESAKAAGMRCVAVAAMGDRAAQGGANVIVQDLRSIAVSHKPNGLFVIAWP
jgi:sugar-phosphatase